MPYDPHISYHGDEYLYKGITGAGEDVAKGAAKALQDYEETKKQKALGETTISLMEQAGDPQITPEFKLKYAQAGHSQQQGMITGLLASVHDQLAQKQEQDQHALAMEHAHYYNVAAAKAAKAPDDPTLYLTDAERAEAAAAHKIPMRTSAGSFQYADAPETDVPDLDKDGNLIYSADGAAYKSGGKYKPVTGPMLQAHIVNQAQKAADKAAKEESDKATEKHSWFKDWFGGGQNGTGDGANLKHTIKQQFKAGKITREEAKKQLSDLGME